MQQQQILKLGAAPSVVVTLAGLGVEDQVIGLWHFEGHQEFISAVRKFILDLGHVSPEVLLRNNRGLSRGFSVRYLAGVILIVGDDGTINIKNALVFSRAKGP